MKNVIFLLFFTFSGSIVVSAQISDDFSDGDLSRNLSWRGDVSRFVIKNGQLQLQDPQPASSNTSVLYTYAPTSRADTTVWRFRVRLGFAPSTSNFARVYLAAAHPDLQAAPAGYFVQIGGISGDQDAVELYRQDDTGTEHLLISGTPGGVGNDPVEIQVRVTRSPGGEWRLEVDYTGGNDFQVQGTARDDRYDILEYFGFVCRYTSSRADRFAFDDVFINPEWRDDQPPEILRFSILESTRMELTFNEPLDSNSARNPSHYDIAFGIGNPREVRWSAEAPQTVSLLLETPLQPFTGYRLTITGVEDRQGNATSGLVTDFGYEPTRSPRPGDLLISEFMANPRNAAGLPEEEYVEIYNASASALQLSGIQIASGGSPRSLEDYKLGPGAYLILCSTADAAVFSTIGPTLGISGFPGLSNAGDEIRLSLSDGTELDYLRYTDDWYDHSGQADGGYALERIDPLLPGNCPGNWRASQDPRGGSPGAQNSVAGAMTEMEPPTLSSAAPLSPRLIQLSFSETLGPWMQQVENYRLTPDLSILSADIRGPQRDSLRLSLSADLQEGTIYDLEILATEDCLGNLGDSPQRISFALPQEAVPGDIRINEVLFYPQSGGVDFVELINVSDKVLNLEGLRIINRDKMSGNIQSQIDFPQLILPGQILALSPEPVDLQDRYPLPDTARIIEAPLPTLDARSGNVTLEWKGLELDAFSYDDEFHSPLLDNTRGVSLERLNPSLPTQEPGNWASAAASVGFATPGYPNSQARRRGPAGTEVFRLENKRFSPDGDGFEDLLVLEYQTQQPGFLANIQIYDAGGRPIKRLARNYALASQGLITWDGSDNDGRKARIGIYIIQIEAFTPAGDKVSEKLTCVLAGRL